MLEGTEEGPERFLDVNTTTPIMLISLVLVAAAAAADPSLFDSYKFTEFDPNKRLKRGAKKGSAKFKSKSKFKRKK